MALPKIQITPVGIGAVADDGTGDKLRIAFERLNSSIASLAEVMRALTLNADPELDTFRKVADIIYRWNTIINGLPTPQQVIDLIEAEAAPVIAALPTPASYAQQITDAIAAAVAALDANSLVKKSGDQLGGALDFVATVSVASAATTDLANVASNNIEVTGAAVVTSFGVRPAGAIRLVRFRDAGLTLTHHAANLILPGAANIITQAGDTAILRSHGAGGWRVFAYQRADGAALVAPPAGPTLADVHALVLAR